MENKETKITEEERLRELREDELVQVTGGASNPMQVLQGNVPGVVIQTTTGQPGGGAQIRIRGTGTMNNADPLIVID